MAAASLADWPADPDVKAIIAGIFTPAMQKIGGMQLKDCVRRLWEAATERGYGDGYLDGMGVGVGAIEGPEIAEASPAPVRDSLPICTLASWTITDPVDAQAPEAALPSTPPVRSLSTTATQTDVPAPSPPLDCAEDKNTCLRCTLFSPPPTPPLRSLMFAFAPASDSPAVDQPGDAPALPIHPTLPPRTTPPPARDFSGLRTGISRPFSTLRRRSARTRIRSSSCKLSTPAAARVQTSIIPPLMPCTSISTVRPLQCHLRVLSPLDWDHDPRLRDLSRALSTLGWVRPA